MWLFRIIWKRKVSCNDNEKSGLSDAISDCQDPERPTKKREGELEPEIPI
jgi:hypothetical protein